MKEIDLTTLVLDKGSHPTRGHGVCVMEAAAWLAGRIHSDRPPCVSPVLGTFLRSWNDALNDETRQRLIPYLPRILNTAGDDEADQRRRKMVWDWVLRTWLPAWLRLAKLDEAVADLETNGEKALSRVNKEARSAAESVAESAAASAAWSTAANAVRSTTAWSAAESSAWTFAANTAVNAAASAAWSAAANAAWSAAWSAAESALKPTVKALQESAFDLLDRVIDAERDPR